MNHSESCINVEVVQNVKNEQGSHEIKRSITTHMIDGNDDSIRYIVGPLLSGLETSEGTESLLNKIIKEVKLVNNQSSLRWSIYIWANVDGIKISVSITMN